MFRIWLHGFPWYNIFSEGKVAPGRPMVLHSTLTSGTVSSSVLRSVSCQNNLKPLHDALNAMQKRTLSFCRSGISDYTAKSCIQGRDNGNNSNNSAGLESGCRV